MVLDFSFTSLLQAIACKALLVILDASIHPDLQMVVAEAGQLKSGEVL
jgi:hypothetical protein